MRVVITLAVFLAPLTGCVSNLSLAAEDQVRAEAALGLITGSVEDLAPGEGPIVVAALETDDVRWRVYSHQVVPSSGPFALRVRNGSYRVAAFRDANRNLRHDPDEPAGAFDGWRAVVVDGGAPRIEGVSVALRRGFDSPRAVTPSARREIRVGDVVSLDDARFRPEVGQMGMWEPYRMLDERGAGLFFLEPYDPARTPVVFVHGMGGNPQEFRALIDGLDADRFQAWVVQYPSGWYLDELAAYLYRALNEVVIEREVPGLCVVAHSMGGLVTRAALDRYTRDHSARPEYLRFFATIASPLGGHPGAASGLALSPVVLPAWRGLSPRSELVTTLYDTPLDPSVHYALFAAHRNGDGDGVVPLRSQLRAEAQEEADLVRVIAASHVGVLADPSLIAALGQELTSHCAAPGSR